MAVAGCRPELAPRGLLVLLLEGDGLLDLVVLNGDQLIVLVTRGVVLGQDRLGLCVFPLGDQPSWRLRNEPDEEDLEQRRDRLQETGDAPSPITRNVVRPEGYPGADEGAEVPERVVDGRVDSAVLRVHELCDQERGGAVGDGDAETEEEAADDEHGDVEAHREQRNAHEHDGAADHDSHAPAEEIGAVRDNRDGEHRAHGHRGRQEAHDGGAGVVEVVLPLRHTLETVDEGAVVSYTTFKG